MRTSFVVTGAGRGIGRAIAERLLADPEASVVAFDLDPDLLAWTEDHPAGSRLLPVTGDAADLVSAERAADTAEAAAPLAGWVNNAAILRDAQLATDGPAAVFDLVSANLGMALIGCAVAVRRFLTAGSGGAIVNLSSHQARRPVPGALAYATAKAGVEGLTRALAVDHGRDGIRVNAVAPGSVVTERYTQALAALSPADAASLEAQVAALHPLGRPALAAEVADAVAWLLSPAASFVSGTVLPVDGARSAYGPDPEAR